MLAGKDGPPRGGRLFQRHDGVSGEDKSTEVEKKKSPQESQGPLMAFCANSLSCFV